METKMVASDLVRLSGDWESLGNEISYWESEKDSVPSLSRSQ